MSLGKILVVDDEKEIALLLEDYLTSEGYQVFVAFDGEEALNQYRSIKPDLVILDIMLPLIEGMEVCRIIRNESQIPIIMLSAKKSDIDKILSLGLGADDYVTKPFSPSVLVARVKAQLRRAKLGGVSLKDEQKNNIVYGGLSIDFLGYTVDLDGKRLELSTKEFLVLKMLVTHPNQVLTKDQIYQQVWGYDEYGDINTVTVHISKLRDKIEKDPSHPQLIKTIWGVGYKFERSNL